MRKKFLTIFLIVFLIVFLIFLITMLMWLGKKSKKEKTETIKIENFACLTGFSFQYPVFKNWEVKAEEKSENECIIWLNWPEDIDFGVPPKIVVTKREELGIKFMKEKMISPVEEEAEKALPFLSKTKKTNPKGVLYDFVFDPSLYVEDFNPPEGHWDYLQFYGNDFGVRIWIISISEEHGFSIDSFVEKVIETLAFHGDNADKVNEKEIIGEWEIKAYALGSSLPLKDNLLLEGDVVFEKERFTIQGNLLVKKPWEKEISPKPVNQSGSYEYKKEDNAIKIINDRYTRGGWSFHGDYRAVLFDSKEDLEKKIKELPDKTSYYVLEEKDGKSYAIFTGFIGYEYR